MRAPPLVGRLALLATFAFFPTALLAQGVTTSAINGIVTGEEGNPLEGATVTATHVPSATAYRALTRAGGVYNIPNMRVGGPYRVNVAMIGYQPKTEENVFLNLGESERIDFRLTPQATQIAGVEVLGETEAIRTGAATTIDPTQVALTPSVKRSTRDLTRLDPRSDGNLSFGGRNWLYNSQSLDGSYFNNSFGLDDPLPGGQANAEPVPFDAVDQVQVAIAPFDVRLGGFTGASINTVTKSGTNDFKATAYTFRRDDNLQGNEVRGNEVVANPQLTYNQSGAALSGPIIKNRLFFFVNGEIERTEDPGTNFLASRGTPRFGVSRVEASVMDAIRDRMIQEYGYDPGPYEGFVHETKNDKFLGKLDWNISDAHTATLRYNYLDATRENPPHPFVLSAFNSGRGPNESSLPFFKSGYQITNNLHSVAAEVNSRGNRFANRFFASYSRFRDSRQPFSEDFPTIEIAEGGVTYTTIGHEPFSIHNILDQDVLQLTNNFTWFAGKHAITVGGNFERFEFFNSFNLFRHGFFLAPAAFGGTTFSSLEEFFDLTDPNNPNQIDFNAMIGTGPFKGELIEVGQISFYVQDEFPVTERFAVTAGIRGDVPIYMTDAVDNPFSRSLNALDENDNPETVDQSEWPDTKILLSPRIGFNWNAVGDRQTQLRGGTGIFTGRLPFVWVGNVLSNPGFNPNIFPGAPPVPTRKGSILQQSFDLNAMDPDFKWPQTWTTDLAIDQQLPWNMFGTLEVIYTKDLNAVYMRNADVRTPVRNVPGPDGRPFFGAPNFELNPDGAGIFVIDNVDEGYSFNVSGQLRKSWAFGARAGIAYAFLHAKNNLRTTEIASVLWSSQPVKGDPNRPELSYSEFGQRHRFVGDFSFTKEWNPRLKTQVGLVVEVAQGNRYISAGGNRYSFIYAGDVNGDGQGGNDLIYIPRDQSEIRLEAFTDANGLHTVAEQWAALNAFIEQDDYLSEHRGEIAERFGLINPWYNTADLRILQDFALTAGGRRHALQLSVDVLNVGNLINSDWGVRKIANAAALTPLRLVRTDPDNTPVFNFTGPTSTFIDDPSLVSRWRAQVGLRYLFNQ
ncbi:MAG TPA: TonB-dependent receptor [Gemmatimonadaceae bacterium]|nr:TonB-dependent receptor [Gemmatimonadaceae bacterium]